MGGVLGHYIDVDRKHHLYSLHGFYVETTLDPDGKLNPAMNAFLEGPRLDKYIDSKNLNR